jgi:hypothetical protein
MSTPTRRNRSPSLRLKIAAISLLSFMVTTACSWLRLRPTAEPGVMCYKAVTPTDTPTPVVMCYEVSLPTETPPSTTFTSPISPLPTPTPTPTSEARRLLLDKLLAEGRFPGDVTRELKS